MKHIERERYRAVAVSEIIQKQGRSVAWLSRQVGLSRQYTSDVVHGRIAVRREIGERIVDVLGVPFFVAFNVSENTLHRSEVTAA